MCFWIYGSLCVHLSRMSRTDCWPKLENLTGVFSKIHSLRLSTIWSISIFYKNWIVCTKQSLWGQIFFFYRISTILQEQWIELANINNKFYTIYENRKLTIENFIDFHRINNKRIPKRACVILQRIRKMRDKCKIIILFQEVLTLISSKI